MNDATATPMARLVHRRWRDREAPDGDVIVFADGSLRVMDLLRTQPPGGSGDPRAESWHWLEILRATEWSTEDWVDVESTHAVHVHGGSRASAGESARHGSIGWVALTRDDGESTLEWLAVSRWSDPFREVALDDTALTAVSTAGRVWTFPRDAPQNVRITLAPGGRG
ncbi:hypothetical protein [Streptomyces sp. CB02460]|uniref:hypothetical protein n=1 Tax=Streptomyces sp. CB02460 TaxID=1703941 RepID=UPI00093E60DF|nr:hypothetical protein [Streptomyces sp. CB02460]OKJ77606.1 hypothetical protein AMK30_00925 [Streptomyces sp. CB02460]